MRHLISKQFVAHHEHKTAEPELGWIDFIHGSVPVQN